MSITDEAVAIANVAALQELQQQIAELKQHLANRRVQHSTRTQFFGLQDGLLHGKQQELLDFETLIRLSGIEQQLYTLFVDPYPILPPTQGGGAAKEPDKKPDKTDKTEAEGTQNKPATGGGMDASTFLCPNCKKKLSVRIG